MRRLGVHASSGFRGGFRSGSYKVVKGFTKLRLAANLQFSYQCLPSTGITNGPQYGTTGKEDLQRSFSSRITGHFWSILFVSEDEHKPRFQGNNEQEISLYFGSLLQIH